MIARVATFNQLDPDALDPGAVERLRDTVRSQPGFRAGFHLHDPQTGKGLSVVIFESPEAFQGTAAALGERPQEQRVGIQPDSVEFFEATEF